MADILAKLKAHFPPDVISWRVGSTTQDKSKGMALAYLDSRDVQDRLDAVCGVNWAVRHPWADGKKLCCEIGIKIDGEWVWRGDGAGDSDVEAEKGAFSDSFKRAAVRWGIGRYLYDMGTPWVQLEAKGRSYVIAQSEVSKLRDLLFKAAKAASSTMATIPPVSSAASTPAVDPEAEWKQLADTIKRDIDGALDSVAVRDILESKSFLDLNKHNATTGKWLKDRAEKRAGAVMQGRAA